jgi:Putative zinc-finger
VRTSDPFEHDDAAYVLGALSEQEHGAFEVHLVTCAACVTRVSTLAAVPTLLTDITADDLAEPDTLLPGLVRSAASARRRQHWLVAGLGGLAAACLVALAVAVSPVVPPSNRPHPQAMTALTASPVQATAALIDHSWGTQIDLNCSATSYARSARLTYGLQLIDRHGRIHNLGTWTLEPGGKTTFVSSTALHRGQISTIEIILPNHTPVLHLTT